MTEFTRIHDRFEYHLEDTNCDVCLYWHDKKAARSQAALTGQAPVYGCTLTACCCEDIKNIAIEQEKIKRKRGFFKCRE